MTERFAAREGVVWDQTTLPHRTLSLEDARALVQVWAEKANECRARSDYAQARCWSNPAAELRTAISRAESQRRLGHVITGGRPLA